MSITSATRIVDIETPIAELGENIDASIALVRADIADLYVVLGDVEAALIIING